MKSKMRILHLIDSGGLYGAENVIINLSIGLRKNDCDSIIGCFTYKDGIESEVGSRAKSLEVETVFFRLRNKIDLTCVTKIASYFKKNNISVVHSHGYKPSLICLLMKIFYNIPYVVTCHLWYIRNVRLLVYAFVEKISMLFAENVIGVSEEIVNNLEKARVPRKKLRLIDNGIDTELYSKIEIIDEQKLRYELGLKKDSLIIGSLGRLTEQKDYKTFVRAAAEVLKEREDVEFIIAGEGHLRSELVSLSKLLGIEHRFHFLGFRNDKMNMLRLMDIFVLSSLDEGLPIAMLEAMAARLPVVATRAGAIPKVIKNGENGMLIEKGDFKQLKESFVLLINDDKKRATFGKKAYNTVKKRYSNDQMAAKYMDVYKEIFGSP